ncbi:hypothetical protein EB796_003007 [Bugula neritina]|uniref:Secreted protein n=1 Tax=Bugula neritina TaxID=10212 RepID=A0A7J7KLF9_BUGNE|nr:hypothetical protein EB796_003007 [Bugula neritina]
MNLTITALMSQTFLADLSCLSSVSPWHLLILYNCKGEVCTGRFVSYPPLVSPLSCAPPSTASALFSISARVF